MRQGLPQGLILPFRGRRHEKRLAPCPQSSRSSLPVFVEMHKWRNVLLTHTQSVLTVQLHVLNVASNGKILAQVGNVLVVFYAVVYAKNEFEYST